MKENRSLQMNPIIHFRIRPGMPMNYRGEIFLTEETKVTLSKNLPVDVKHPYSTLITETREAVDSAEHSY